MRELTLVHHETWTDDPQTQTWRELGSRREGVLPIESGIKSWPFTDVSEIAGWLLTRHVNSGERVEKWKPGSR